MRGIVGTVNLGYVGGASCSVLRRVSDKVRTTRNVESRKRKHQSGKCGISSNRCDSLVLRSRNGLFVVRLVAACCGTIARERISVIISMRRTVAYLALMLFTMAVISVWYVASEGYGGA